MTRSGSPPAPPAEGPEGPAARSAGGWSRRQILASIGAAGCGNAVFGRALAALAAGGPDSGAGRPRVSARMIERAAWVAGIPLSEAERQLMVEGLEELLDDYRRNRAVALANHHRPALAFRPAAAPAEESSGPSRASQRAAAAAVPEPVPGLLPVSGNDLAFATVGRLAGLLRSRRVSSVELTRLYLDRLERYGPRLACVISLLRRPALEQAEEADRELAAGRWRGPLHGVPWGVKDLLAVPGTRTTCTRTTWGALPFRRQAFAAKATVVRRLEDAGAVLIAKLALGALAMGDVWFGGQTRNPWNLEQGSSGSSSGSAAATAAGLAGFAIASETYGSIVSPCTRCGATGLRPTFGRVSRHGAMTLSWSMDKIGVVARSAEDCALVFQAVHGADALDPAAVDGPAVTWPWTRYPRELRVGYTPDLFEEDRAAQFAKTRKARARQLEWRKNDLRSLDELRALGLELVPVRLPGAYPVASLELILAAEVACVFDGLMRGGRDQPLVVNETTWPSYLLEGQLIPAVEYLRAQRIRTLLMGEMAKLMAGVDLYVSPTLGGSNLLLTNLTGHPCVVVPNGFASGTPTSITFTGRLYGESAVLAVAHAYQRATGYHLERPPIGSV